MKLPNRDLIVLLRDDSMSQQAIDHAVECIDTLLRISESEEKFCTAHELVKRNRITQAPKKILKAIRQVELKAFYFLINKN